MAGPGVARESAPSTASEIARSAVEAARTVKLGFDFTRYMDPPASTAYPLEYAFHLLGDVRGKAVLDYGCGSGENLVSLVKRGAVATGIDLSPHLLELARKRLELFGVDAELVEGSAHDTGLRAGSFDAVLCIAILHHLDLTLARRELLRLLKPGGLLVILEPVRFSWTAKQVRRFLPQPEEVSEGEYPLSKRQLRFLADELVPVSCRSFRSLFAAPLLGEGSEIARLSWHADSWLLSHLPPMRHFATVRVAAFRAPGETERAAQQTGSANRGSDSVPTAVAL